MQIYQRNLHKIKIQYKDYKKQYNNIKENNQDLVENYKINKIQYKN
jgi:hypothetical protein